MTPKLLVNAGIEAEGPATEANDRQDVLQPVRGTGQVAMAHLIQRIFLSSEQASRQVLFASVDEYCDATEVCSLAARLLAEQPGRTVCLVDAKTRQPRLAPERPGAARPHAERTDTNLWLVGGDKPSALREQLIRLRGEFDYVLVDAPAIGHSEDAAVLGSIVDGVVLVLRAGVTRRIAARRAKQTLEEAGVTVLGAVLRDRTFPVPESIYRRI